MVSSLFARMEKKILDLLCFPYLCLVFAIIPINSGNGATINIYKLAIYKVYLLLMIYA